MRLTVDLSALHAAVRKMGAENLRLDFSLEKNSDVLDQIDIALSGEGIEVELKDVNIKSGLLSYRGRQVLLYIQDHGKRIHSVFEDPEKGNRYHIANCRKLVEMRERGRFERYVATNVLTGSFLISGMDYYTGKEFKGEAALKVCKYCLGHLNYQGYRQGSRSLIFSQFSIDDFFAAYSSFFPYMPRRKAGDKDGAYTDDWPIISGQYKADQGFKCELCGVDLSSEKKLLHTHHKNGVKTDNQRSNFQALCVDCHRKQPAHERMFVRHEDMQLITRLRREQNHDRRRLNWDDIFELADTGVHGVLHLCRAKNMSVPVVGHAIKAPGGSVVAQLELAWPLKKIGVAIADKDLDVARQQGWQAWSMIDALEQF
ncbi:HNH endonuclease [Thiocystis violacea]|uniref:HNH endonuclease n=1 Tax=Thiocystis violacea TaxID=13725 RepID=UPI0019041E56|nr:HNH endonuclease [Thiocystis violacea]MBK1724259.1 hypothetical protein [Thiocystis violacea]